MMKHVATVVSFQQLEGDASAAAKDAQTCPIASCLGQKVPHYRYPVACCSRRSRVARSGSPDSITLVPDVVTEARRALVQDAEEGALVSCGDCVSSKPQPQQTATGPCSTLAHQALSVFDLGSSESELLSTPVLLQKQHSTDSAGVVPVAETEASTPANAGSPVSLDTGTAPSDPPASVHAPVQTGADSAATVIQLGPVVGRSLLDTLLIGLWEDAAEQGLFRYDVTACESRVLPGQYGFVAQLNEGRATKKRPTEFRVDQVCQEFDSSKFHFGKAYLREALMVFEPQEPLSLNTPSSGSGKPQQQQQQVAAVAAKTWLVAGSEGDRGSVGGAQLALGGSRGHSNGGQVAVLEEAPLSAEAATMVLINVSPIEYGHVLLVPRLLDCLPQRLDAPSLTAALHLAREAGNPYFRVGYNSLGAYATINHLHFQAYYLAAPFACERAPCAPLPGLKRRRGPLRVSRLTQYPVNGFVLDVQGDPAEDPSCLVQLAELAARAAGAMQSANVPFNLLITDAGARVFIWPQCYAERQAAGQVPDDLLDTGVNPAVFEIAGHLVLKRAEDYAVADQEWAWRLLAAVSLTEERFAAVARMCFGAA